MPWESFEGVELVTSQLGGLVQLPQASGLYRQEHD